MRSPRELLALLLHFTDSSLHGSAGGLQLLVLRIQVGALVFEESSRSLDFIFLLGPRVALIECLELSVLELLCLEDDLP